MCVHRCMYKHILPKGAFVAARREMGSLLHVFVLFGQFEAIFGGAGLTSCELHSSPGGIK